MKHNILVVDDEEDIRLSIKGILEDENYEVALAKNSDEVMKAISFKVPDLILLDIWLENSKLDGIELLNYIVSTFKNIPCIIISEEQVLNCIHIKSYVELLKIAKVKKLWYINEQIYYEG